MKKFEWGVVREEDKHLTGWRLARHVAGSLLLVAVSVSAIGNYLGYW